MWLTVSRNEYVKGGKYQVTLKLDLRIRREWKTTNRHQWQSMSHARNLFLPELNNWKKQGIL
jgi:hypothetical protein